MTTTSASMATLARVAWQRFEPCHAVTYFAPEARDAYEAAGLRGFWRGYFAGRLAPLGPIGPELGAAVCFVFEPAMVARALPDIWDRCSPAGALDARVAGAVAALRRAFDGIEADVVADAAALGREVAEGSEVGGRPLFAANAGLPWPDDPYARFWHATTLLREYRGDGHVHALAAAEVGPCEALVLHAATGVPEPVHLRENRGWSGEAWLAAREELTRRGWLTTDGALTDAGARARENIEDQTDALAAAPFARAGEQRCEAFIRAIEPLAARVADQIVPYPNPMGVPRP